MPRALTLKTRLDTLKKEAKRWLKALRAGDRAARVRLEAVWPKAPADPGLRDVQHALAREHGLEGWAALKAALDEMAISRLTHAARVEAVLRHGWDGDAATARRILARHPEIAGDSLFTAATCGDVDAVRALLARDPTAAMRTGGPKAWTALAYVVYGRLDDHHAVDIARLLLDVGADPNFGFDDGWGCPFKLVTGAIGQGEGVKPTHPQAKALVELLIAAGADPFDTQALYNTSIVDDDIRWTDLLWRRCEERALTDRWRKPAPGLGGRLRLPALDYLLGNAVGSNHLRRAIWLLDHGANPDTPHAYTGQPVLALARLSGFGDIATLLERHGARPAELTDVEAFQAACLNGDADAARTLVRADPWLVADPRPLLAAASFGQPAAVDLLLSLGVAIGAADKDGITALHRAVQSGDAATIDRLVAAGAEIDRREGRWQGTALSWALVLGKPHLAERLAPLSRDVRALASLGRLDRLDAVLAEDPALANHRLANDWPTPLYCLPDDEAAAVEVAETLLRHGADPRIRNELSQTPADIAESRGLDEAAELIRAATA